MTSIRSIRTFFGARDFDVSRAFYQDFGFREIRILDNMSYFEKEGFGFYLQDSYVKEWVDNSMIFLEVDDTKKYLEEVKALKLTEKYESVRLSEIVNKDWGCEFFLHDPSGVLWHIGQFH